MGAASGMINFGADPLWRINPQGAIAVRFFKLSNSFWKYKRDNYDFVSATDGAWGALDDYSFGGSIGGILKNHDGKTIILFSGPVPSINALDTELHSVLRIILWVINLCFAHKRVVVCTDLSEVVSAFNEGISIKFPLKCVDFEFEHLVNKFIFIQFVPRYLNEQTDDLAKKGLSRPNLIEIGEGQANLLDNSSISIQLSQDSQ